MNRTYKSILVVLLIFLSSCGTQNRSNEEIVQDEIGLPISEDCLFDSLDVVTNSDGSRTCAAIISCNQIGISACLIEAKKQGFNEILYDSTLTIPYFFTTRINHGDTILWKNMEVDNGVDRSYRVINVNTNQIYYYQVWN